ISISVAVSVKPVRDQYPSMCCLRIFSKVPHISGQVSSMCIRQTGSHMLSTFRSRSYLTYSQSSRILLLSAEPVLSNYCSFKENTKTPCICQAGNPSDEPGLTSGPTSDHRLSVYSRRCPVLGWLDDSSSTSSGRDWWPVLDDERCAQIRRLIHPPARPAA
ncbi:hypothetical protein LSH36_118g07061, partial [Paralvinella palmiformis]